MLAHREHRLFTPEEYLLIDEGSPIKSEYYKGEIFSMSGGSMEHNQLVRNLTRLLGNALLDSPCQVFVADMRLQVVAHGLFTYPDVYVVCGPPSRMNGRSDTLIDATLVIEVLSPKTELYDRGEKFLLYQSLPSFREYLLVSQQEQKVEHHVRLQRRGWRSSSLGEGESLTLKSIGCVLAMTDIYLGVEVTRRV